MYFEDQIIEHVNDTSVGNTIEENLQIIQEEGFEIVKEFHFTGTPYGSTEEYNETLYVLFNYADGVLAVVESHREKRINKAFLYFNWIPERQDAGVTLNFPVSYVLLDHEGYTLWVGNTAVISGFRKKWKTLKDTGSFVTPWVERPTIQRKVQSKDMNQPMGEDALEHADWLTTYRDSKDAPATHPERYAYYNTVNEARIMELPEDVQEVIVQGLTPRQGYGSSEKRKIRLS